MFIVLICALDNFGKTIFFAIHYVSESIRCRFWRRSIDQVGRKQVSLDAEFVDPSKTTRVDVTSLSPPSSSSSSSLSSMNVCTLCSLEYNESFAENLTKVSDNSAPKMQSYLPLFLTRPN